MTDPSSGDVPLVQRIQSMARSFHPRHFPYQRVLLTLMIGFFAGWSFFSLNIPLPWMLGPMCACTVLVLFNVKVAAPPKIRTPMLSVTGVMLGSTFSPQLLSHLPEWLRSMGILLVFLVICGTLSVAFYRHIGKFDPVTAYYSGMPGGLVEMSIMGEERGGDGKTISLIHSARILIIVSTVPFIVQYLEGIHLGPRQASKLSVIDAPASTMFWIIGTAIAGYYLGKLLRMPAKHMFGPLLLSIAVHGAGLTDFVIPREIASFAQIVIGCATGCRFIGTAKAEIFRILRLALGATLLMLAVACVGSWLTALAFGVKITPLLLAFAPAGIAEMSLIALAMNIDVAFVMVHQIVRVMLTALLATPLFRLIGWDRAR